MRTTKRRLPVAVAGPHRKHPGASRITAPLFQLEDAEDHVASGKVLKVKAKLKVKAG